MPHVPAHTARLTAAPFSPVSVADLQSHSVIDHNDDDDLLAIYIATATAQVEADTGTALVKQQWQASQNCFPAVFYLPRPPLLSVDSIKYFDTDGIEQTLDPSAYQVSVVGIVGRIAPAPGTSWPAVQANRLDAVTVIYQSGFVDVVNGQAQNPAPVQLCQAIYVLAAHFYENREVSVTGTIVSDMPMSYQMLVAGHTVSGL